MQNQINNEDFN